MAFNFRNRPFALSRSNLRRLDSRLMMTKLGKLVVHRWDDRRYGGADLRAIRAKHGVGRPPHA